MGLAAGQARLLSITRRKSDCEFLSMTYSHQKMAISRQLENLSNNYTNSLNQTKLMYDFYGTNSEAGSQQLNYGLLMMPSALNNYEPKLVTTNTGKVVLNSKYAAAARAAGIPPEGLGNGSLPSDYVRNQFIEALYGQHMITGQQNIDIQSVAYDQTAGLGGMYNVDTTYVSMNYSDLLETLNLYTVKPYESLVTNGSDLARILKTSSGYDYYGNLGDNLQTEYTLKELLEGNVALVVEDSNSPNNNILNDSSRAYQYLTNLTCFNDIMYTMEDLLGTNERSVTALNYAREQATKIYKTCQYWQRDPSSISANTHKKWIVNRITNSNKMGSLGLCAYIRSGADTNDFLGINISNWFKAYLAAYTDYMTGLTGEYGVQYVKYPDSKPHDKTGVNSGESGGGFSKVKTINENDTTELFPVGVETETHTGNDYLAGFYDTLFNMICQCGWTENNNVEDKEYLQNMLTSGAMFLAAKSDDEYYYQENYASDSLIREEEDTTAVAEAEAKYNAQKLRLSNKEDAIDLKMKNLDTELSALQTEYDSVKKTIDKNISNTFKRYS